MVGLYVPDGADDIDGLVDGCCIICIVGWFVVVLTGVNGAKDGVGALDCTIGADVA